MTAHVRERLLPWLLVLSALLFATPYSPLVDDPYPHLAGTGWVVLALVPLALVVAWRGTAPRAAWPFVLALAWALVSWRAARVTDTFEARRALCGLAALPLAFVGGAALDARGRGTLASLLVALSCAWTGLALARGFSALVRAGEGEFAGVLGDTGSLSQAALAGAAVAGAWLAREAGARRVLGGAALLLFLAHVAAAPVIAGSHTLLFGFLVAASRAARGRACFLGLALAALLAPFMGMAARQALGGEPPVLEGAPGDSSHALGGLGVRAMVWSSALGLVADHPLVGAGPGQFQAAFPPYRNPREIELSRHGVCSELDTEVEHAHNDWLQAFCELGLVGGGLFALGLALAARAAWLALRSEELVPFAVAALALLVNAFVHAPFSSNPAACVLAFALLGAVSRSPAPGSRLAAALAAAATLAAACFVAPLVRHGEALRERVAAVRELVVRAQGVDPEDPPQRAALEAHGAASRAARDAAPDSVPALILAARDAPGSPEPWEPVLARRPHAVEAWEQSATVLARAGRVAEARERYLEALSLSPTHPRILRNLARLECTQGELARGLGAIASLRAEGCLVQGWQDSLGSELVLVLGRPARGAEVLLGRPLAELLPDELHARAREPYTQEPVPVELLAHHARHAPEASECLAQLLWAREHAASGAHEVALRNYRQAAERSQAARERERTPAPLYALELAAAALRAGRLDEARERSAGVALDGETWRELPGWAREAVLELGLESPE